MSIEQKRQKRRAPKIGHAVANVVLFASFAGTAAVAAPESAPEAADAGGGLAIENILVTAQKRETRLQDTPASIVALSDSLLKNASIDGANDLTKAVPGLVVTDGGAGQRRFSLRGIRSSGDSQVGVYYDESPVTGPPGTTSDAGGNQSDLRLFDVERVEVLRGPQGTLYGAGSMGGTVRVIYRKPSLTEFEGSVDVTGTTTAHGGEGYQLNIAFNIPLVTDKLAARLVYFRRDNQGWIDNPGLGLKNINGEDTDGGRLLVRFVPTDWLTLDAAVHYQDTQSAPSTWSPSAGEYNAVNRAQLSFADEAKLYSLSGTAELGFAKLVATTTYQERDTVLVRDPYYLLNGAYNSQTFCRRHFSAATCATPAGMTSFNAYVDSVTPLSYYAPQELKNWTNEVRLQSDGNGPLNWTVGAYFEDRKAAVHSLGVLVDDHGALIKDAPLVFDRQVRDHLQQKAGFGEISYAVIPDLTLTAGLRYYDYKKTIEGDTSKGFDLINFAVQPWTVRKSDASGWLYKFNASYKASDNILVYAQAASGYRPGGANQVLGLPGAFTPYEPDSLWTYEAGVKTSFLDGRALFNATGFLTDWKNMQVTGNSGTFAFLTNAGSARIKGVELEAAISPLDGLQFSANATILSAKLVEDQINDLVIASGRKGDRIPNIPELAFTLAGQYERDLADGLTGLIRADVNFVGRSYADFRPTSSNYRKIGDYTVVSARTGVRNDRWGAYIFVNNIFDVVARTSAANVLGGTIETITTSPPRTVGLNLTTSF